MPYRQEKVDNFIFRESLLYTKILKNISVTKQYNMYKNGKHILLHPKNKKAPENKF